MRPATTVGLILIVVGAATLFLGGSFTTEKSQLDVGNLRVTTSVAHKVSPWLATGAILVGAVLLLTGAGAPSAGRR